MGAGVLTVLIKPQAGDVAVAVGAELDAKFYGRGLIAVRAGRRGYRPDAARTGRRRSGREGPHLILGERIAGEVLDAAAAAFDGSRVRSAPGERGARRECRDGVRITD